ncbi:hypothetical protein NC652_010647 [Populus alba x Populus x berolinensis]|nr:hypothetical protein NC652_010647 [Populus alba x Populus x berolinensis]
MFLVKRRAKNIFVNRENFFLECCSALRSMEN